LRFRHLREQHGLTQSLFAAIAGLLEEQRLLPGVGTIVDATIVDAMIVDAMIVAAPSSTKNATATRDPEMKQTRKGKNWHFGMKLHIGADRRGLVHTLPATNAAAADITQLLALLHGQEREVLGDQAYWKEADRQAFAARGVRYRINRRPKRGAPLSAGSGSTALARGPAPVARMPSAWSNICGGSSRRGTAAWPRTWPTRRPCSPWLISTKSGTNCARAGRASRCEGTDRGHQLRHRPARYQALLDATLLNPILMNPALNRRCLPTCAELP
jgi:IS5 family transposase